MGEKLLARRFLRLLRDNNGQSSKVARALVEWAGDQREWLWPNKEWPSTPTDNAIRWDSLPVLAGLVDEAGQEPELFKYVDAVAALLEFDGFERELLRVVAAMERLPRLAALHVKLSNSGEDMLSLMGLFAGAGIADSGRRVRRSGPVSLGLLVPSSDTGGGLQLSLHWRLARILDEGSSDEAHLIEILTGIRQQAELGPEDFKEQGETFSLLRRLLGGALRNRAVGINILIHGPPGTGKTEFARTLAADIGASLFAVGEFDCDGEEPSRYERLHALKWSQHLLARRGESLVLFDEMEDLFAEANSVAGGGRRRAGSKIFVNRLLEANPVPTIWTSNEIDPIDPAHLRRMSFVFRMDHPSSATQKRIVARLGEAEETEEAAHGLAALLPRETETASVARTALRAAALAGGKPEDAEAIGRSLLAGLRGGRVMAPEPNGVVDLDLYESDPPMASLVTRLAAPDTPAGFSLLLTGAPGTGKSVLAAHIAERIDRPLKVKRASDLLSKWVGETEANIAEAFAEARDTGAVLLFDEVDSLLLDRSDARRSWEVTQVNELLTWMDTHPLPFIAATNHPRRLDPAALRRFLFKIRLCELTRERAARAFVRFFGMPAPTELERLRGLTPGDFQVVARQLRFRPAAADEIVDLLAAELTTRPAPAHPIGFALNRRD